MLIPKGLSAQWILRRWGWRCGRLDRRWASSGHVCDTIDYSVGFANMARHGRRHRRGQRPLAVIRVIPKDEAS
ncbi:hypothetical protein KCP70_15635 [Salmonella enterica subsp. enterica]|nr:hypothetical protein KCP70_15635 [Salmonella enterica subsp. enterica]